MHITVECGADRHGMRSPRRFSLDGRDVDVAEVLDRWNGFDHIYFKVRGDDSNLYILRLDESRDSWELTMFESPEATGAGRPSDLRKSLRRDGF